MDIRQKVNLRRALNHLNSALLAMDNISRGPDLGPIETKLDRMYDVIDMEKTRLENLLKTI